MCENGKISMTTCIKIDIDQKRGKEKNKEFSSCGNVCGMFKKFGEKIKPQVAAVKVFTKQ